MSKVTIEYELPEDNTEFECSLKGTAMHSALFDIRNKIFRPARKYGGYADHPEVTLTLFEVELIDMLEEKFNQILEDNDLETFKF